jgi:SAM-dependent methyltransferase
MTNPLLYRHVVDPLLSGVHKAAAGMVSGNPKVLDIACGTGALALLLSKKASSVTGIDNAKPMVDAANKASDRKGIANANFYLQDAAHLPSATSEAYDLAVLSMAIHQFPIAVSLRLLRGLEQLTAELLLVDYACPLPGNFYKPVVFGIERMAGQTHFRHFKAYMQFGGLPAYLEQTGLLIGEERTAGKGIFTLVKCKYPNT